MQARRTALSKLFRNRKLKSPLPIARKREQIALVVASELIKDAKRRINSRKWGLMTSNQEFCRWLGGELDEAAKKLEGGQKNPQLIFSTDWVGDFLKKHAKKLGFDYSVFVRNNRRDVRGQITSPGRYKLSFSALLMGPKAELANYQTLAVDIARDMSPKQMRHLLDNYATLGHVAANKGTYAELLQSAIRKRLAKLKSP